MLYEVITVVFAAVVLSIEFWARQDRGHKKAGMPAASTQFLIDFFIVWFTC